MQEENVPLQHDVLQFNLSTLWTNMFDKKRGGPDPLDPPPPRSAPELCCTPSVWSVIPTHKVKVQASWWALGLNFYSSLKYLLLSVASSYNPSSHFSMCSLSKLEGTARINHIIATLVEEQKTLVSLAGIKLDKATQHQLNEIDDPRIKIEIIINQWVAGKSKEPSTWEALLKILSRFNMDEMVIDIEDYMHGEWSLIHQKPMHNYECTTALGSGLLEAV